MANPKFDSPCLMQWTAIFMAGFAVAWVIRTPRESNAHQYAERTVLPDRRPQSSKPAEPVGTNTKPRGVSKWSANAERSIWEASTELLDAQGLLARAQQTAFKGDPV